MQTSTTPWDYRKRIMLVSRLVRLCAVCGSGTYLRPSDGRIACLSCGSTETVEMWEHMAEVFRRGLMELEQRKAAELAEELAPQAAELRRGLTAISYLNGDEPTERW